MKKRLCAFLLASVSLVSVMMSATGCTQNEVVTEASEIESDTPWYSATSFKVADNCDAKTHFQCSYSIPVVIGDRVAIDYGATEMENGNFTTFDPTCIFDTEGNLIKEFDIQDEIDHSARLGIAQEGDKIAFYYSSKDTVYKVYIDKDTGELGEPQAIDLGIRSSSIQEFHVLGDYIFAVTINLGKPSLVVFENEEKVFEKELVSEYFYISSLVAVDGGFKIVAENVKYFYDTEKNELKNEGATDFVDYEGGSGNITGFDGRTYSVKADGIYADGELYLSFNDCEGNMVKLADSQLVAVEEDRIVLVYRLDAMSVSPEMIFLNKEKTNPNAGKEIVRAVISDWYSMPIMTADAISRVNENDPDHFISCEYILKEKSDLFDEEKVKKMTDDLQLDIMSSEPADIYFDLHNMWWVQSEDYLLDLNKELVISPTEFYTAITDSAARDGGLYYMPLDFIAHGIVTDSSNVKEGVTGFTFDEYREFLKGPLNGKDPLTEVFGRSKYFNFCFEAMSDYWFKSGIVDINNDAFRELCSFIMNDVPENAALDESDVMEFYFKSEDVARYELLDPMLFVHTFAAYKSPVLLGAPSVDGRGPVASVYSSVSVSAKTEHKDACIKFVKLLLSKEIQEGSSHNPINRNALEPILRNAVDEANREIDSFSSEAEAASCGYYRPSEEIVQAYIKSINSVSCCNCLDASVSDIVEEEIEGLLSGQQDVDTVAANVEDRLRTLYNEKGL